MQVVGTLGWIDNPPYRHAVTYDDTTPHYIVYNADTRVLSIYPNVMVLEDDDVADPDAFARRLAGAPYNVHVACTQRRRINPSGVREGVEGLLCARAACVLARAGQACAKATAQTKGA